MSPTCMVWDILFREASQQQRLLWLELVSSLGMLVRLGDQVESRQGWLLFIIGA